MNTSPVYHVIDPAVLLEVAAGNQEVALTLTRTYIASAPATFERLLQAFSSANLSGIASQCHALKGMTMLIGAVQLTKLLENMERAARQQQRLPEAEAGLPALHQAVLNEMALSLAHASQQPG